MATTKTHLWTTISLTKKFCKVITAYRATILAAVDATVTDPASRATVVAMFDAVVAGCAVLTAAFPNV